MNTFKLAVAIVAVGLSCTQAMAINKCTDAEGRTVFQDAPCQGKGEVMTVKPASGRSPQPVVAASGAGQAPSEARRIEDLVETSRRDRRRRDLEAREVPQAVGALETHRRTCEQQQASLADQQYRYVQNLYGKTHAAQVASEMAAVSARCETKDRELKERMEALKAECAALAGCK